MSNAATVENFRSQFQNDDELMHYGIMGMHWGIRRFQPYGQGYDAEHEGREVGLAARMGGGHGSFSSTYGRGAKKSLGDAVRSLGKKAGRSVNEGLERLNYANDRLGEGLKNVGKKATSGLAKYASTTKIPKIAGGARIEDPLAQRVIENQGFSGALRIASHTFARNSKTHIKDLKHTSFDDVKAALGSGASKFQDALSRTMTGSKEFGRNAALAASMFRGASDHSSSASQILEGRFNNSVNERRVGAGRTGALGGLEDLGAGRGFQTRNNMTMRDLIRKADPYKGNKALGGLESLGTRFDSITGERVQPRNPGFKNARRQLTDPYERRIGGPLTYDGDWKHEHVTKGSKPDDLKTARSALLSDLGDKTSKEWGKVLDGKDALEKLVEGMHSFESITGPNRVRLTDDPYEHRQMQDLEKRLGIGKSKYTYRR